jgi:hypothetical protein
MTSLTRGIKRLFHRDNGTSREAAGKARLGLEGLENRELLDAALGSYLLLQAVEAVRVAPVESVRYLPAVQEAKPAKESVALPAVQAAKPVKDKVLLQQTAKPAKQTMSREFLTK